MKRYDAIIIGTGQAGPTLASRLADAGMSVAVAERGQFGGTCVNTGCTPTKTLVASARVAHIARRAAEFGVLLEGPVNVDLSRAMMRKDDVVRASREGLQKWMHSTENIDVYEGHARFEGPHTVRVNDDVLIGERIYINVGTRASVPDWPDLAPGVAMTNAGILKLEDVPEHLVIIGGSYIGLEFGQMFRRFGSQVTIVEMRDRLVTREDPDVSKTLLDLLESEGITVRTGAECISVSGGRGNLTVSVDCAEEPRAVTGTHLLVATGRRPNTDDLGLENTGIEVDDKGFILVGDTLETSEPGVWALGDVNGKGAFTHTAYNDHEIVADNLLSGDSRSVRDRILTYALYVDPPFARAGMSEHEARQLDRDVLVAKRSMTRVSRAVEKGETRGFMKVLVDAATKQILGFAIIGPGGDEVAHSVLDIMYAKAPYTVIQRAVHIHPTVSELIPTLLGDLQPLENQS